MSGHRIAGSGAWNTGFVDSGTTFTYLPPRMWDELLLHFDYWCEETEELNEEIGEKKYCPGKRVKTRHEGENYSCFTFDKELFKNRDKEYLMGWPII